MTRVAWGMLVVVLAGLLMVAIPPAAAQQASSDQYATQEQAQPGTGQTGTAPEAMQQQPGAMEQPAPQAQAQPTAPGEYPNVAGLRPFSPEADYMSIPGYLRWQVWRDQGTWLSYAEARRIVIAQGGQLYHAA